MKRWTPYDKLKFTFKWKNRDREVYWHTHGIMDGGNVFRAYFDNKTKYFYVEYTRDGFASEKLIHGVKFVPCVDTQYTIGVEKDKKGNEHVVVLGKDVDLIELSSLWDK